MSVESLTAAFLIGLLGAGHCLGMCGGIAAALSFAIPKEKKTAKICILLGYNIGRISSYGLVGALFGLLGQTLIHGLFQEFGMLILRGLAGVLLILMGLYLAQWSRLLTFLERLGIPVWKRLKPISDKLMPVKSTRQALALGMIWGWLPCGLVYSTLAFASAQASPFTSMLVMVVFGLGTLPAVFLGGLASSGLKAFLQSLSFRRASAILLIVFGVWTLYSIYDHSVNHGAHHSGHIGESSTEGVDEHHHHHHN